MGVYVPGARNYVLGVHTCDRAYEGPEAQRDKVREELDELRQALDDVQAVGYVERVLWELIDVCTATMTLLARMGVTQAEVGMVAQKISDRNTYKRRT